MLKLGSGFESRYAIAARIDRNLWLVRDRLHPDYGGRPWTMWTANSSLANEVVEGGLRWVVVER